MYVLIAIAFLAGVSTSVALCYFMQPSDGHAPALTPATTTPEAVPANGQEQAAWAAA